MWIEKTYKGYLLFFKHKLLCFLHQHIKNKINKNYEKKKDFHCDSAKDVKSGMNAGMESEIGLIREVGKDF